MSQFFSGEAFLVVLLVLYAGGAIASLVGGDRPQALYHAGAFILTTAVLWMRGRS